MSVCLYLGSFDPFHKGHQEVANEALQYANLVIILPNNPNKHKPGRSNIIYRSHLLSLIYPLYNDNSYFSEIGIVVDTRNIDVAIVEIKKYFRDIMAIVGSDIIKKPKCIVNKYIINERDYHPIKNNKLFDEQFSKLCTIIPSGKLKHQFISSTYIRNNKHLSADLVPSEIVKFVMKQSLPSLTSLSYRTLKHEIIDDVLIKTFDTIENADSYVSGCKKFNSITGNPFVTSKIIKQEANQVYETYLINEGTLLTAIDREDADDIFKCFFKKLSIIHIVTGIVHGDMGGANVLLINSTNGEYVFGSIDYEKCKNGDRMSKLREYFQFIFSFKFYGLRNGRDYDINKLISIGKHYYTNILYYTKDEIDDQFNYWNDRKQSKEFMQNK